MLKDQNGGLQNLIISAVHLLREPAGKKYSCPEDINNNFVQFIKDFHLGLFQLHVMTIYAIMSAEEEMEKIGSLSPSEARTAKKYWERVRQILRCINDSIVWTALRKEPSLFIRRTCQRRSRGYLKDQNPESIIKALRHLLSGGRCLPIWNDATRCVDIGDIALFSLEGHSFIELKEGEVNDSISEIMLKTDEVEITDDIKNFVEKYGQKGLDQIDRVVRQREVADTLVKLVEEDTVFDPLLGMQRVAIDPPEALERYDDEMAPILATLKAVDFVEHSVDSCLHILGINRNRVSLVAGRALVEQHFQSRAIRTNDDQANCKDHIFSLGSSLDYPTAMPLMLRCWESEDIARICIGHFEIYFLFDMNAWAKHLKLSQLVWSSKKLGRREVNKKHEDRVMVVQDRIPQIKSSNGQIFSLGTQLLQYMICEGIRPSSMAEYYDHISSMLNT